MTPTPRTARPSTSFSALVERTWRENLLFSVLVELTYRCNLDCFFCYNDLDLRGEPLSPEQYFRFFEDLRDLQVLNLSLSGRRAAGPSRLPAPGRARRASSASWCASSPTATPCAASWRGASGTRSIPSWSR